MLKYTLIQELYQTLDQSKKKELLHALFGDGNQTMAYFKNGRDSRFSKVEILSDYLGVPIDSLREGTKYCFSEKTDSLSVNTDASSADKQKIQLLEERIKLLQDALSVKEERISLLLEKNDFYKSQAGK